MSVGGKILEEIVGTSTAAQGTSFIPTSTSETTTLRQLTDADLQIERGLARFSEIFQPVGDFNWRVFGVNLVLLMICCFIGLSIWVALRLLVPFFVGRKDKDIANAIVKYTSIPFLLLSMFLMMFIVAPALSPPSGETLEHIIKIGSIAFSAWLIVRMLKVGGVYVNKYHPVGGEENKHLRSRVRQTQFAVVNKTVTVLVVLCAVAAILMTFERVQQVGLTVLASAGVLALVIGLAARPVLENLIASIQIALTQPLKLNDRVILNDEWCQVERELVVYSSLCIDKYIEITTTYVTLRVWDGRRLLVPFSIIISQVFENWTVSSGELIGTVYCNVGHNVPLRAVRKKFQKLLDKSELYDGRASSVLVTDSKEHYKELRFSFSVQNSDDWWTMRCYIREQMLYWLTKRYPDCMPRWTVEMRDKIEKEKSFKEFKLQPEEAQVTTKAVAPMGQKEIDLRRRQQMDEDSSDMDDASTTSNALTSASTDSMSSSQTDDDDDGNDERHPHRHRLRRWRFGRRARG